MALRAEIEAAASKPAVLLVQFALPHGPAVREAAMRQGLPYAVHLRGDDVWIWPHAREEQLLAFREVVRDAALVIGVSRTILREAQRLVGPLPIPVAVVPNGIDTELFCPASGVVRARIRYELGIRKEERVVLCVAPQLVSKGWIELLDALGALPDVGGPLVLYGVISSLRDEVDVLGETAIRAPAVRVVIERDLRRHQLADVFRAADVLALASHSEGMSNAVLEGLASGLAVVATDVGGHSEVIDSGENGVLVPPRDTSALRDALEKVLSSAGLRRDMGGLATQRARCIGDSISAGLRLSRLLDAVVQRELRPALLDADPYAKVPEPISGTRMESL